MSHSRTWIDAIDPPLPAPEDIVAMGPGDVHIAAENRITALLEVLQKRTCAVFFLIGDFFDHTNLQALLAKKGKEKEHGNKGRIRKRELKCIRLLEE